jgi:nucleoside-diphosphate-sugar epimerase
MELKGATVAVTGATGFIGRYLVDALQEAGATVVAAVRNPARAADLGATVRRADLADRAALTAAFDGADAVVSNAALLSFGTGSRHELVETNVVGTQNVLHAARDAGARRVVQLSSATVYRPRSDRFYREEHALREEGGFRLPINDYAVSKASAERAAQRLASELHLTVNAVRPHTVFGAFDSKSFTLWLRRFMSFPVSMFPTHLFLPPVYAGDLARAVCHILERGDDGAYNVAHRPDEHSYWDLMDAYRQAGGRMPRLVLPVPVPLRLRFSVDRIHDLGWEPRPLVTSFRDMFRREQLD